MTDNFKETTLKGHVQLCELRYQALETRLDGLESRLAKMETDVSSLKSTMQSGFGEIKLLLEQRNTSKINQTIATTGTLLAAIIGLVGYIIVKL